jgi:excisionase family DNA binding protein
METVDNALLTPEEVADTLRVSTRTVLDWLRTSQLPGLKVGRRWRVRRTGLDAFLKAGETRADAA